MTKFLLAIKVMQLKDDKIRFNPYNPLSYIFAILALIITSPAIICALFQYRYPDENTKNKLFRS